MLVGRPLFFDLGRPGRLLACLGMCRVGVLGLGWVGWLVGWCWGCWDVARVMMVLRGRGFGSWLEGEGERGFWGRETDPNPRISGLES